MNTKIITNQLRTLPSQNPKDIQEYIQQDSKTSFSFQKLIELLLMPHLNILQKFNNNAFQTPYSAMTSYAKQNPEWAKQLYS